MKVEEPTELCDGVILWHLLEIISNSKLPKLPSKAPKNKIQKIENVFIDYKFTKDAGIKLVNISPEDIVEGIITKHLSIHFAYHFLSGNKKLILGFLFALILHYQIAGSRNEEEDDEEEEVVEEVVEPVTVVQHEEEVPKEVEEKIEVLSVTTEMRRMELRKKKSSRFELSPEQDLLNWTNKILERTGDLRVKDFKHR